MYTWDYNTSEKSSKIYEDQISGRFFLLVTFGDTTISSKIKHFICTYVKLIIDL